MNPTDPVNYRKLRHQAVGMARKAGFINHADDFAQVALLKLSQGRKTTLDNLLTDYLRETFGRSNVVNKDALETRRAIESRWHDLETNDVPDPTQVKEGQDFHTHLKDLEPKERAMLVLLYKWDMTLKEVGEVFGVTESRTSQVVTAIHAKLRKRLKRSELSI